MPAYAASVAILLHTAFHLFSMRKPPKSQGIVFPVHSDGHPALLFSLFSHFPAIEKRPQLRKVVHRDENARHTFPILSDPFFIRNPTHLH